jgi:hypothetical protein
MCFTDIFWSSLDDFSGLQKYFWKSLKFFIFF